MHKNAFLLLKNCKNCPALALPAAGGFAPRPPMASGGWGFCPSPLRISGYATALRPHELKGRGLRQGGHFTDK